MGLILLFLIPTMAFAGMAVALSGGRPAAAAAHQRNDRHRRDLRCAGREPMSKRFTRSIGLARWLMPGLGVKRWLLLAVLGAVLMSRLNLVFRYLLVNL